MEWIRCASIKTNKIYYVFMDKEDVQSRIQNKTDRITAIQYKNSLYYAISTCNRGLNLGRGTIGDYDKINVFIKNFINSRHYGDEITTILVKSTPNDINIQDMSDNDPLVMLLRSENMRW